MGNDQIMVAVRWLGYGIRCPMGLCSDRAILRKRQRRSHPDRQLRNADSTHHLSNDRRHAPRHATERTNQRSCDRIAHCNITDSCIRRQQRILQTNRLTPHAFPDFVGEQVKNRNASLFGRRFSQQVGPEGHDPTTFGL